MEKSAEIKITTSGFFKNVNFDNNIDSVKIKQPRASTQSGNIEEQNKASVIAINGGDSVAAFSPSSLPQEILLKIPYHTLENSDILPEFVDFMAIWDKMPTHIQLR